MNYTVDYITKPATPERVLQLLNDLDEDLAKLERIEAHRGTWGNDYRGTVERLRNTYYLAESLARELGIIDPDGDDLEVKAPIRLNGVEMAVKSRDPEFIAWSQAQLALSEGWSW